MSKVQTSPAPSTASIEPMQSSAHALHDTFEGTAAQLVAAGVLPVGFKFPTRSKDLCFIAENGYRYVVEELWEPRGRYSVSVALKDRDAIKAMAEKMEADIMKLCAALPRPSRMGGLMTYIFTVFNSLPGAPLRLSSVMGSSDDLKNLNFEILGPRVMVGARCYGVASLLEYFVIERGLATGEIKKPSGYLLKPTTGEAVSVPAPVKRRAVARLLEAA